MTITNLCDNVVLCLFAGNPDIMGQDMLDLPLYFQTPVIT